jgi:hypothetical protein
VVLVLGIIAAAVVGILYGPDVYHRWQEARRAPTAPSAVQQPPPHEAPDLPPVEVSSDRLQADYAANEIAADQRYRGRPLRVTGAVRAIRYMSNSPYMELWTTNEFASVDAWFDPAWTNDLARINAGDHVAVRCVGGGMAMMRPQLRRCWPEAK